MTRDVNGQLADFWEWPWYWRYSSGVLLLAASAFASLYFSDRLDGWRALVIPGAGVFFALAVMYELGCLVIFLGFVIGGGWAIGLVIPGDMTMDPKGWAFVAIGVAAWAAYRAHEAKKAADENALQLRAITAQLNDTRNSSSFVRDDLYERIRELEKGNN